MAQPDMLLELGSGTKLSIFDDFTTKADISQAGVVSTVASAVKGWQRYRSADCQPQQNGATDAAAAAGVCQSGQDSVIGNNSGTTVGPDSTSVIVETAEQEQTGSAAGDVMPTVTSDAATASLATVCAEARDADAPGQTSEGMPGSMVSDSGSSAGSSAVLRKVGFAEPDREEVEETGKTSLTGSSDVGKAATEAQQASAADLRARVAAGMRRCAACLIMLHTDCMLASSNVSCSYACILFVSWMSRQCMCFSVCPAHCVDYLSVWPNGTV